jgi:phage shock protein PspC (stress-responsive transcriptional regulator)
MNKVININFQGRVIPIEEPAYEELKKYVESLRQYFANEEGKEEIINDIENRIAELFSEKLKISGSSFISEAHVETIIASMGRPEQFEEPVSSTSSTSSTPSTPSTSSTSSTSSSLYRNANDKILGGVCSGLAAYFKIDTTIIRVLFAMLAVGSFGFGLLLYVVLWAILPERYLNATVVTRKLYRDPEQKVLGGVCSGIAQYFNIQVWIPRLIFAIPFILGALESILEWVHFSGVFSLSLGTWSIIYIILWAVVPKAMTPSEKMEMKGEKVDLESIKNKFREEMSEVGANLKEKTGRWKNEFGSKASALGQEARESAHHFAGEAGPAIKRSGNGFLRFLSTIIRVFFYIIGGIIAVSLIAVIIALLGAGNALMPLNNFMVRSYSIQWYAWGTLILFFLVPVIGIIQWIVRSIIGHKTKKPWIGITLSVLWVLGWLCLMMLATTVSKQYRKLGSNKSEVALQQPSNGKMLINFTNAAGNYYPLDVWADDFDINQDTDGILMSRNEDSLLISNIRLRIEKSQDDSFHVTLIRRARAESAPEAEIFAERVDYSVSQQDSILNLPLAFPINNKDKFRNQQVIVEIKVPVGKEIYVDKKSDRLHWFNVRGGATGISVQIDEDESIWRSGIWYIMTQNGLEKKYKDQITEEEAIENLELKLREEIRKENLKVEDMDIKITDKDTIIDINVGDIAPEKRTEEDNVADKKFKMGRGLLLGTMRLLKVNS